MNAAKRKWIANLPEKNAPKPKIAAVAAAVTTAVVEDVDATLAEAVEIAIPVVVAAVKEAEAAEVATPKAATAQAEGHRKTNVDAQAAKATVSAAKATPPRVPAKGASHPPFAAS